MPGWAQRGARGPGGGRPALEALHVRVRARGRIEGEEPLVLRGVGLGQAVTREVPPGAHRLRVHNTLFWRTQEFRVQVGEHASFMAINRAGWGTYSIVALLIGGMMIYLTLERENIPPPL